MYQLVRQRGGSHRRGGGGGANGFNNNNHHHHHHHNQPLPSNESPDHALEQCLIDIFNSQGEGQLTAMGQLIRCRLPHNKKKLKPFIDARPHLFESVPYKDQVYRLRRNRGGGNVGGGYQQQQEPYVASPREQLNQQHQPMHPSSIPTTSNGTVPPNRLDQLQGAVETFFADFFQEVGRTDPNMGALAQAFLLHFGSSMTQQVAAYLNTREDLFVSHHQTERGGGNGGTGTGTSAGPSSIPPLHGKGRQLEYIHRKREHSPSGYLNTHPIIELIEEEGEYREGELSDVEDIADPPPEKRQRTSGTTTTYHQQQQQQYTQYEIPVLPQEINRDTNYNNSSKRMMVPKTTEIKCVSKQNGRVLFQSFLKVDTGNGCIVDEDLGCWKEPEIAEIIADVAFCKLLYDNGDKELSGVGVHQLNRRLESYTAGDGDMRGQFWEVVMSEKGFKEVVKELQDPGNTVAMKLWLATCKNNVTSPPLGQVNVPSGGGGDKGAEDTQWQQQQFTSSAPTDPRRRRRVVVE